VLAAWCPKGAEGIPLSGDPKGKPFGNEKIYLGGRTVDIDALRDKAARGSTSAQSILGIYYLNGLEVAPDYQEALRLLSLASGKGAPRARLNLARIYQEGLGIEKDIPKAIHLYKQAADAGEFLAQIALGRIYSRGGPVLIDADAAFKSYSAAAAQQGVAECPEMQEAKDYVAAFQRASPK
jgi:TPR repeat protein